MRSTPVTFGPQCRRFAAKFSGPSSASVIPETGGTLLRTVTLSVNGMTRTCTVDDRATLFDVLRNHLCLTGTRFGCGAEQVWRCAFPRAAR
ncbi:MAG: hypothetical protein ISS15_07550 [Alphaproteobacteria bacterium]|nr:hypothetical protein [Alphaproteobacteria bacterium]